MEHPIVDRSTRVSVATVARDMNGRAGVRNARMSSGRRLARRASRSGRRVSARASRLARREATPSPRVRERRRASSRGRRGRTRAQAQNVRERHRGILRSGTLGMPSPCSTVWFARLSTRARRSCSSRGGGGGRGGGWRGGVPRVRRRDGASGAFGARASKEALVARAHGVGTHGTI